MKRISRFFATLIFIPVGFFCFLIDAAAECNCSVKKPAPSATAPLFVVETSQADAEASLDRVSGQIDRGFAPAENTYVSPNHQKIDPLRQDPAHKEEAAQR